jgi:RNA polymerase sigma factor (sigma-70 family)
VDLLVEHLFRHESGRVLATMVRLVGDVSAAEEIVQEALLAALERWPLSGVPPNPGGWLMVTARNRALDRLRRARGFASHQEALAHELDGLTADDAAPDMDAIPDDRLRLIFTCCHPVLSRESQVALTLKLLGGLSTAEVARAFLAAEPTIAQRIVRAKRTIQTARLPYEVPEPGEIPARLPAVLAVLYLIFNEGYTARAGDALVRHELCDEALRLTALVDRLLPDQPEVLGLRALMDLQASRSAARVSADGTLVLLADQDRSRWDRGRIDQALAVLTRTRELRAPGPYLLQAEIAACHATASSWEKTDWRRMVALYDELVDRSPSPVVELNRAVAIGMRDGPAAGLAIVDELVAAPELRDYHLLPATRADFLRRLERWETAAAEYRRALALTQNERERDFLRRRLAECEAAPASEGACRSRSGGAAPLPPTPSA